MIKELYLVETVNYAYFDEKDMEDVEDRYIIGYFDNPEIMKRAIEICNKKKEPDEEVKVTKYSFSCSSNQKYVYVLFYEYSTLTDGEYTDYYYYFEPCSNVLKCIKQKTELQKNEKYMHNENKIYDDSKDGFRIAKILINFIDYYYYYNK